MSVGQYNQSKLASYASDPYIIRWFIDNAVANVVSASKSLISMHNPKNISDVIQNSQRLVVMSYSFRTKAKALKKFLYQNMYFNPAVERINEQAASRLESLFEYLVKHPSELDEFYYHRIENSGLQRTICDFVSSHTDQAILEKCDRVSV